MYNKVTFHSGISSCPVQSFPPFYLKKRNFFNLYNLTQHGLAWIGSAQQLGSARRGLNSKILGYICYEIISEVLSNRFLQNCTLS